MTHETSLLRPDIRNGKPSKLLKLEMMRGFAALYVLGGHIALAKLPGSWAVARFPFRFGQEAVMLFFLLSGFVIYYATHRQPDRSFRGYFLRRWNRIFPIFLLALLVSYLDAAAAIGSPPVVSRLELFGNILMLQDFAFAKPGVFVNTFLGNSPLWSLSYEWWFYMLFFPIYRFVPDKNQLRLVFAIALFGFMTYTIRSNQLSLFGLYFILWWCGAELARTYLAGCIPNTTTQRTSLWAVGAILALLVGRLVMLWRQGYPLQYGVDPVLPVRHFASCWILLLLSLLWAKYAWYGFEWVFRPFALVAPISYAIYVLHYPLCVHGGLLRWVGPAWACVLAGVALTFAIAYFAEHKLQKGAARVSNWLGARLYGKSWIRI